MSFSARIFAAATIMVVSNFPVYSARAVNGCPSVPLAAVSKTGAASASDNHAILTTAPTINSSSPLASVATVPEPSVWAVFAAAGALMTVTIGRRRNHRV